MADPTKKDAWRNGHWYSEQMPFLIWAVDGDKMEGRNMISLDYPDIEGSYPGTLESGDFGPARDDP